MHENDNDYTVRNATVVKVKIDKRGNTLVYIETDNGYKTHRIPYHLKKRGRKYFQNVLEYGLSIEYKTNRCIDSMVKIRLLITYLLHN